VETGSVVAYWASFEAMSAGGSLRWNESGELFYGTDAVIGGLGRGGGES